LTIENIITGLDLKLQGKYANICLRIGKWDYIYLEIMLKLLGGRHDFALLSSAIGYQR